MKIIKVLLFFVINNIINLFVFLSNIFIWRRKKIWIVGAWFGDRFADNSRYLYQYLFERKEQYKIKRIIWVTRSNDVYNKMKECGYDVIKLHGFKSFFYHLRSGVHVLCNNASFSTQKHDLNTYLSFGAKKIQLWHGAGIKACGRLANFKQSSFTKLYYNFIFRYGQPGMWGRCFQVAISEENARVVKEDYAIMDKKIIKAFYPRDCSISLHLFKEEQKIVDEILEIKKTHKVILYLPTFKNSSSGFVFPENIDGFETFLNENKYFWIQKSHCVASELSQNNNHIQNLMTLDSRFDINIILDYVDMVITDYSSVTTDALSKNKITLEYCPDFDYYKDKDRGFVSDFEKYHVGDKVTEPEALFDEIKNRFNSDFVNSESYHKIQEFLLDGKEWTMDEVVDRIFHAIHFHYHQ